MENNNIIIVGRKDIELYCFSVLLKCEKCTEIVLSSRGGNNNKAERLASLFKRIGLDETKRENILENNEPTLKITLSINTRIVQV